MFRSKILSSGAAILALLGLVCNFAPAYAADNALTRITSAKTLRVGVAEFPPFVAKNAQSGELEGFEVDAGRMLGEEMGVKVEFVEMTWPTLVAGLQSGRYDVVMSGMGRAIQRAMAVSFSDPYVSLVEMAMVRGDTGINSWADVTKSNGSVAAVLGGLTYLKADANKDQLGSAKLTPFKELAIAGNAVISKQAVAWIEDVVSIQSFMKAHPNVPLKTVTVPFVGRGAGNAYAVRQGDPDLLGVLNIFVNKMQNSGAYRTLGKKWGLPDVIIIPGVMEGR